MSSLAAAIRPIEHTQEISPEAGLQLDLGVKRGGAPLPLTAALSKELAGQLTEKEAAVLASLEVVCSGGKRAIAAAIKDIAGAQSFSDFAPADKAQLLRPYIALADSANFTAKLDSLNQRQVLELMLKSGPEGAANMPDLVNRNLNGKPALLAAEPGKSQTVLQNLFSIARSESEYFDVNDNTPKKSALLSGLIDELGKPNHFSKKFTGTCVPANAGYLLVDESPATYSRYMQEWITQGKTTLLNGDECRLDIIATLQPSEREDAKNMRTISARMFLASAMQYGTDNQYNPILDVTGADQVGLTTPQAEKLLEGFLGVGFRVETAFKLTHAANGPAGGAIERDQEKTASVMNTLQDALGRRERTITSVRYSANGETIDHDILTTNIARTDDGKTYVYYRDPFGTVDAPVGKRFLGGSSELVDPNACLLRVEIGKFRELIAAVAVRDDKFKGVDPDRYFGALPESRPK